MSNFLGYLSMSPGLHPGFSELWRSPPALSSTLTAFGCLLFLIVQASSFFIHLPFPNNSQLGHLWWPTPHFAVPVKLTGRYTTSLVTSYFPPNSVTASAMDLREHFFVFRRFLPWTLSCCFQGFPGSRQFNLELSRASCWSWKHSPSPAICLNHSNLQKICTGRFYLRARSGQSQNISLYGTLALKCLLLAGFKLSSR